MKIYMIFNVWLFALKILFYYSKVRDEMRRKRLLKIQMGFREENKKERRKKLIRKINKLLFKKSRSNYF